MDWLTNQNNETDKQKKHKQENTKKLPNLNFSKSKGFDCQVYPSSTFRQHFHSEIAETSFFYILSLNKLNRNSTGTLELGSDVLVFHDPLET